jgi:hypothetical protein
MTTFKEIRGTAIQVLSSDPSNPIEGQIWYNSSSGTLKGYQNATLNTWASGGNFPTTTGSAMSAGTQTAGILFGGYGPSDAIANITATYNGTAWTNSPATLNTARGSGGGAGTQTAALAFNGASPTSPPPSNATTATESYNGTSWTTVNSMNTSRWIGAGTGIQTAAIYAGGYVPAGSPQSVSATESWNGSSWTTVNSINSQRGYVVGSGTQTAAVIYGGYNWSGPGTSSATETYNGTNWTSVNSMPAVTYAHGGSGSQTAALSFGGTGNFCALWNGTSWTNTNNLGTPRNSSTKQVGTQNNALAVGGGYDTFPTTNITEEFIGIGLGTKTLTVS